MKVVLDVIRKLDIPFLRRQQPLTLFLEVGRLRFDGFEGFGQAGQVVQ